MVRLLSNNKTFKNHGNNRQTQAVFQVRRNILQQNLHGALDENTRAEMSHIFC